ncbi:inositol monophosphatase [Blastomonas sp.]|uniref:inositol monophosphatase family protein n=1 Tax=Blastomonas sp. TaxID=1909299 RepID=UPI00359484D6
MHSLHRAISALIETVSRDVVLHHYQQLSVSQIENKAPGDLVTFADKESERRLSAGLAAILPGASIVGEEAVEADPALIERVNDSDAWIIDPIDGTHNYAHGHPPFGIIIALIEAGETVAGWLYDPLAKRMCHAVRGGGAFINGTPVLAKESGETLPVAALSTLFIEEPRRSAINAAAEGRLRLVDIPRCAAEQYPRLVLGQNDVTLFERTLPWDHAAGVLFLAEAGGKAARLDGTRYLPGDRRTGMIAAASPRLWDEAAAILSV